MGQFGIGDRIRNKALQIIMSSRDGIRYAELKRRIQSSLHYNLNTIGGSIWDLDQRMPSMVYKPERGVFKPKGRALRVHRKAAGPSAVSGISARIRAAALEFIKTAPDGIRYGELKRRIGSSLGYNLNTIGGSIWDLDRRFPAEVYKPERGVFKPRVQPRVPVPARDEPRVSDHVPRSLVTYETEDVDLKAHVDEINRAYDAKCYTACFILCRKVLENLVFHRVIRPKFGKNKATIDDICFVPGTNRMLGFEQWLKNLLRRSNDFGADKTLVERICRRALLFKDEANDYAHSLYHLAKPDELEKIDVQSILDHIRKLDTLISG
jgi:hypothetical protein